MREIKILMRKIFRVLLSTPLSHLRPLSIVLSTMEVILSAMEEKSRSPTSPLTCQGHQQAEHTGLILSLDLPLRSFLFNSLSLFNLSAEKFLIAASLLIAVYLSASSSDAFVNSAF